MSIQSKIEALMVEADMLRPIPDDDPAKAPLAGIVDEINALRAIQAAPGFVDEAPEAVVVEDEPKRKPGRPAKHRVEGDDA